MGRWRDHFEEMLHRPAPSNPPDITGASEVLDVNCERPDREEITKAIGLLKTGKAPGPDEDLHRNAVRYDWEDMGHRRNTNRIERRVPCKDSNNGVILTNEEDQIGRWEDHFEELLNRPAPSNPPDITGASEVLDVNCERPDREEITKAIGLLKTGKAPGPDEDLHRNAVRYDWEDMGHRRNTNRIERRVPCKDSNNGVILTNEEDQIGRWEDHFEELLNRPAPSNPPDITGASEVLDVNCERPDREEITKAIGLLKTGKAPGPDEDLHRNAVRYDWEDMGHRRNTNRIERRVPCKDSNNGVILTNEEYQIGRWEDHFEELLNRPAPSNPPDITGASEVLDVNCERPDREEITKAIGLLKTGKAPGPDEIPAEAIKADKETSIEMLYDLIGKMRDTDEIPIGWK